MVLVSVAVLVVGPAGHMLLSELGADLDSEPLLDVVRIYTVAADEIDACALRHRR